MKRGNAECSAINNSSRPIPCPWASRYGSAQLALARVTRAQKRPRRGVPRSLVSGLSAGATSGEGDQSKVLALRFGLGPLFRRGLFCPAAGEQARVACCGQLGPASRTTQPWSSLVHAYRVLSLTVCGDAGRRIKPPQAPPVCRLLRYNGPERRQSFADRNCANRRLIGSSS